MSRPAAPSFSARRAAVRPAAVAMLAAVAILVTFGLATVGLPSARAASIPPEPFVGQLAMFRVDISGQRAGILTTVRYVGEHSVIYLENGQPVLNSSVSALARAFDDIIYPRLTEELGAEPNPGVDGSSRISIVIYDMGDPQLSGYFDPQDMDLSTTAGLESNHREMFYLNATTLLANQYQAAAAAAHEFAHLIQYYRDFMLDPSPARSPEAKWVQEGVAMYAEMVTGYPASARDQLRSFELDADKNLTLWAGGFLSDYGASTAFVSYLLERTRDGFIRALVGQPQDGIFGIDAALADLGYFDTFATIFDDWVIAGFLDGRGRATPPWTYQTLELAVEAESPAGLTPWVGAASVKGHAARYFDIPPTPEGSSVRAVVDGQDDTPLHAALIGWDSRALKPSVVTNLDLQRGNSGGTATAPSGFGRHTLVVWARGPESADLTYSFRYSVAMDPVGDIQFLDVGSEHPFFHYIEALRLAGVVSGKELPPGSGLWYYRSDDRVLRAQFAKMAVEVAGLHTTEVEVLGGPTFTDVSLQRDSYGDPTPYPYDYVEEAAAAGIVGGYPDGLFRPWEPMRRIHLVRMILRAASAAGLPLEPYSGSEQVFSDVPPGSPLYADVMTAYAHGIMSGSPDGASGLRLDPWGSATRGHVAKMTANLMDLLGDASE